MDAVEHTGGVGTYNLYFLGGDVDFVSLRLVEILRNHFEHNTVGLALVFLNFHGKAHDVVHVLVQELRLTLKTIFEIDFRRRL